MRRASSPAQGNGMTAVNVELLKRTLGCGEVSPEDAERQRSVVLTGWVHRRRDLGQLIFIELRDRTGFVQLVFDPSVSPEAHREAEGLRQEFVVGVRGEVVTRESPNPKHPTGMVEVRAAELTIHNRAESVPFPVEDATEANEEVRLTHRYVDLRRPAMQRVLRTPSKRAGLEGYGLEIVDQVPLEARPNEENFDYLRTKREKLGHLLNLMN